MGPRTLKRGDVVLFAGGKPRPGIIVQADGLQTPIDVLVCPFTTTLIDAPLYRPAVEPSEGNKLTARSQLMADKVSPVPRDKIARVIGRLDEPDIARLDVALATILDLGI